jgi:hypothetical protein
LVLAVLQGAASATDVAVTDEVTVDGDVGSDVAIDGATIEDAVDAVDEPPAAVEQAVAVDAEQTVAVAAEAPIKTTTVPPPGDVDVSEGATVGVTVGSAPTDANDTSSGKDSSAKPVAQEKGKKKRSERQEDSVQEVVSTGHQIRGPVPVRTRVESSVASRLARTGLNVLAPVLVALMLMTLGGGACTAARARPVPIGLR